MSHFTDVEVNFEQKNEAEVVAALEKKFGKDTVEVHEGEGAALYGWHGDNRSKLSPKSQDYAPPCNLIVRRKNVGDAANDIGLKRLENGKYKLYVSDYDKGATYTPEDQGRVAQEYGVRVAEKALKAKGWQTERKHLDNGVVRVVTVGQGWGGTQNWG